MRTLIRNLTAEELTRITIQLPNGNEYEITHPMALDSFVYFAKDSELFFRNHEMSEREFELTLHFDGGRARHYAGNVPERHLDDIVLEFRAGSTLSELILPGCRDWLDACTR